MDHKLTVVHLANKFCVMVQHKYSYRASVKENVLFKTGSFFFAAFAKWRKVTISFVVSVRP
jgi:hypothetical protein